MTESENFVRRSFRNPSLNLLNKKDVTNFIEKIKSNHKDTIILKVKNHIFSDINSDVLNQIIESLNENSVCQALYLQNLSEAFRDEQLTNLLSLLKTKSIWCLNLGENYNISTRMWQTFCNELENTFVTHLYVSEHVIAAKLKIRMREAIR